MFQKQKCEIPGKQCFLSIKIALLKSIPFQNIFIFLLIKIVFSKLYNIKV